MSKKSEPVRASAKAAVFAPQRIVKAWENNDADAFADACAEDATMILVDDVYLAGREQIRDFMKKAYDTFYKGTRVTGVPLSVQSLSDDVAVVVTRGGVIKAGATELAAEDAIRATWIVARYGDEWLVAGYQNTYIAARAAA
jgi:uncharacterized protein (TIGR02246 family)